jgi:predicted nuclease with TOPRIM domain
MAADDKYSALEEKVAMLQEQNAKLKEKIGNLEKQLAEIQGAALTQEEEAIIKLLVNFPNGTSAQYIASILNIHRAKAEHFLNQLFESEHVGMSGSHMSGQVMYYLYPRGQEYAVKHGFA